MRSKFSLVARAATQLRELSAGRPARLKVVARAILSQGAPIGVERECLDGLRAAARYQMQGRYPQAYAKAKHALQRALRRAAAPPPRTSSNPTSSDQS